MKYIIIEISGNHQVSFLFPEMIMHDQFYILIRSKISEWQPVIISAGFVKISYDEIICYGHSTSLDIVSREKIDADIIRKNLGKENEPSV